MPLAFINPAEIETEDSFRFDEGTSSLFRDLCLVSKIDKKINESLPFFYNYSFVGGYFNMPSARMKKAGEIAIGVALVPPYQTYGVNFQVFDHVELCANYRIFNGILEGNFGHEGFGDDAERIGNAKIALLLPEDGFSCLPSIAVGAEDFIGTKRFNSQYIVATQQWMNWNLEASLGWARGRIKGLFGGAIWSPFRQTPFTYLQNLGLIAEYDATNYKKHAHEHPKGRTVRTRINAGLSYSLYDALQISVSSVRGEKVAGSVSIRCPIGTSKGFFPKIDDPITYLSPVDTEPLGVTRPEKEFVHQLAYAFGDQGLDLYTAYLVIDEKEKKHLWLKVVNNRYREENTVRDRLQHLLGALTPSDILDVTVVIEADALPSQSYHYRTEDLQKYHLGLIGQFELETLAPRQEAVRPPPRFDSVLLFQRNKKIWVFTVRPRLLTFFGSAKGKFKFNIGLAATPEGYLFDEVYYKFQFAYQIKSNTTGLSTTDRLNPSQLPNVRTDTLKYYRTNTLSMEQAYIQKDWNLGKGCFFRMAGGYFEPAYGGGAAEILYYPANANWAIGAEAASVLKRRYKGVAFTHKIRQMKKGKLKHVHFFGVQYFLDFYYDFKPLDLDIRITAGQFLAKDKGIRTEIGRYFPSGLRFSLWTTVTNGHDKVNRKTYFDKGFSFLIPLDMFLKQSSRNYIAYAMSAWLRDVGAQAETGKRLYNTLYEERFNPAFCTHGL
ncbi:MAG TPA: YjbH domain-containing protein [Chlamydiales bacterium]|nr:YjbH domain-containing protein [Chlamydiales bacterium]